MHDMLVRLYDLPDLPPALDGARRAGVSVRRALAPEVAAQVPPAKHPDTLPV